MEVHDVSFPPTRAVYHEDKIEVTFADPNLLNIVRGYSLCLQACARLGISCGAVGETGEATINLKPGESVKDVNASPPPCIKKGQILIPELSQKQANLISRFFRVFTG